MPRIPKLDLSTLPRNYQKVNKKWWKDTHTGQYIPASRIQDYLPQSPDLAQLKHEAIMAKRFDLKY